MMALESRVFLHNESSILKFMFYFSRFFLLLSKSSTILNFQRLFVFFSLIPLFRPFYPSTPRPKSPSIRIRLFNVWISEDFFRRRGPLADWLAVTTLSSMSKPRLLCPSLVVAVLLFFFCSCCFSFVRDNSINIVKVSPPLAAKAIW